MEDRAKQLLSILRIAHEVSINGAGASLASAIRRSQYREMRPTLQEAEFIPLVHAHPDLIDQWLAYSSDKRTIGGWYVLPTGQVGQADGFRPAIQFESIEHAIAGYVLRELDFWAGVGAG